MILKLLLNTPMENVYENNDECNPNKTPACSHWIVY